MSALAPHVLSFIELNTDPGLPFSDVLDKSIQDARREATAAFEAYEVEARKRRPVDWWSKRGKGCVVS